MTLQTSGAISLSQVQSEFGGSNPISMSEYYRGGANVPSTRTVREPTSGAYSNSNKPSGWGQTLWIDNAGGGTDAFWNDTQVVDVANDVTSYTTGGYTYYRSGTPVYAQYVGDTYDIFRTSLQNINTSIPSSGVISMNNFYGGQN